MARWDAAENDCAAQISAAWEAADEIERLRKELNQAQRSRDAWIDVNNACGRALASQSKL